MNNLMSLHQLARSLRLDRDWLRKEALAGQIPCLRAGTKLVFSLDAVKKALADRAAASREVSHAG